MKSKPLNTAFFEIRNYLAGKVIGITRDQSLMHEVVKCLFCKMHSLSEPMDRLDNEKLAVLYRNSFQSIKERVQSIFLPEEEILLDPDSIAFV
ncbi:MAG: hypothetical protein KAI88_02675, partial [Nitrosomonadaceae bacterium]|nr:hypothetical protein [Nitrosomonadaceae bacterium]